MKSQVLNLTPGGSMKLLHIKLEPELEVGDPGARLEVLSLKARTWTPIVLTMYISTFTE
jgi:hypothetical protein